MEPHLGPLLSALVDGELTGDALAEAERHVAACAECRAAYEDLRRVAREARALEDRPPARDLWGGIAARISGATAVVPLAGRRRRFTFTLPQLAAAALVLVTVSAGGAVLLTRGSAGTGLTGQGAPAALAAPLAATASAKGIESYAAAIRDLEAALAARSPQLDTATVRAVRQSLAVIDVAIRQAEAALAQDPNSLYLNNHLEHALDRKLELLRRVTTLSMAS
jgi:negative regulator of sigma E activity